MYDNLSFVMDNIFKMPWDASLFKYSLAFPAKKNIREKKLESAYHHDGSPSCWPGDTPQSLKLSVVPENGGLLILKQGLFFVQSPVVMEIVNSVNFTG